MANEIVRAGGQELNPYEEFGAESSSSREHIHGNLLRFTKHGKYIDGQNQDEIEIGTRMLVYMPSLKKGWVRWEDGTPIKHVLGLVHERYQPPQRSELGDHDEATWTMLGGRRTDPWQKTFFLTMLDEEGVLHTYTTSSKGGEQTLSDLGKLYGRHIRMKPEELPVIELNATSYDHPEYGETFKPIFKQVSWATAPADFDELKTLLSSGADPAMIVSEKTEVFPTKTKATPRAAAKKPPPPARKKNGPNKGVRF